MATNVKEKVAEKTDPTADAPVAQAMEEASSPASIKPILDNLILPNIPSGPPPLKTDKPRLKIRAIAKQHSLREYAIIEHVVVVPSTHLLEDVFEAGYLWNLHNLMNRGHHVILHHELWYWEYHARVIKVDNDLQLITLSPTLGLVEHNQQTRSLDWKQVRIEHKGALGRWTILFGNSSLKSGFETEQEAHDWIVRKRKGLI